MDVIEINHGYIDLIKHYSEHSKIFKDPRISIYIDDGRRWLTRSKEKYDFILILKTAIKLKLYRYVNYRKTPKMYCNKLIDNIPI